MDTGVHDKQRLKELQALPLDRKILITQTRIIEWYTRWKGQVYVSFSGGKDSTVLLHIARQCFPDIEAVFVNTGLEYPEIQKFAKSFENVTVLRPKMRFDEVITHYGYPIISKSVANCIRLAKNGSPFRLKRMRGEVMLKNGKKSWFNTEKYAPIMSCDFEVSELCCDVMKKMPTKDFEKQTGKKPIIATMAQESLSREKNWLAFGCNAFDSTRPKSAPMSFWTEQDVLEYIVRYNLPIAPVYGEVVTTDDSCKLCTTGCDRTGCIFCAFGAHTHRDDRFIRLKDSHPRQYEYCIGGGEHDENGVWRPNKQGLGMGHVFDELNKIYGENFIRYK